MYQCNKLFIECLFVNDKDNEQQFRACLRFFGYRKVGECDITKGVEYILKFMLLLLFYYFFVIQGGTI